MGTEQRDKNKPVDFRIGIAGAALKEERNLVREVLVQGTTLKALLRLPRRFTPYAKSPVTQVPPKAVVKPTN